MKSVTDRLFDTKHPLRIALVCLVVALGNAYEAAYIDSPNGFMSIVSWVFAAGGLLGFLAFLLNAVSDYY